MVQLTAKMEQVPTEILYVICSLLSIDDVLGFRLVQKRWAEIGAAFMLPEVTFYIHPQELQRLKEISLHPVISRHVLSLTYFAQTFDSPAISWRQFVREHKQRMRWNCKLKKLNLTPSQLMAEYRKYAEAVAQQDAIEKGGYDVAVLDEVLPRFIRLEAMTMSAGQLFYEGRIRTRRKSPLREYLWSNCLSRIHPEGKRQLEALLQTNARANCALTALRAGSLHWRFFKRSEHELMYLFQPLANLTYIELNISVDPADERINEGNSLAKCQRLLSRGGLRKVLKSMPLLRTLNVEVANFQCNIRERGACLRDIIEPGFRWQHLTELVLGGLATDRQELADTLQLHNSTLSNLCLRDMTLQSTSWRKLLPYIRNNLYLQDACICGDIYGHLEDYQEAEEEDSQSEFSEEGELEHWHLSVPELDGHDMRESINMYCREGGQKYPDELPVRESVVDKWYDQWVAPFFENSDDDSGAGDSAYGDGIDLDGLRAEADNDRTWEDITDEEESEDDTSGAPLDGLATEQAGLAFDLLIAGTLNSPFEFEQHDGGSEGGDSQHDLLHAHNAHNDHDMDHNGLHTP
ncbi:hypothetical protein GGS20DRAFT_573097 [Poronia punctata]|nr:hypothetical protein GGS20DRAFT_573097 [Poronia punctata]